MTTLDFVKTQIKSSHAFYADEKLSSSHDVFVRLCKSRTITSKAKATLIVYKHTQRRLGGNTIVKDSVAVARMVGWGVEPPPPANIAQITDFRIIY